MKLKNHAFNRNATFSNLNYAHIAVLILFLTGCATQTSHPALLHPQGPNAFPEVYFTYDTVEERLWDRRVTEKTPEHTYAGETSGGHLAGIGASTETIATNLLGNEYPDVFMSLFYGQTSGLDTRIEPLLFENLGQSFVLANDQVQGGMPLMSGARRTRLLEAPNDIPGLVAMGHENGDGTYNDALMLSQIEGRPVNTTEDLPELPMSLDSGTLHTDGRRHIVNIHAMGAGDITGNGLSDLVVAEMGSWDHGGYDDGPYILKQNEPGKFEVVHDRALKSLLLNPYSSGPLHPVMTEITVEDFNNNGHADILMGWGLIRQVSILFFNDGNGGFSRRNMQVLPQPVYGGRKAIHLRTMTADFNANGYQDALILYGFQDGNNPDQYYAGYSFNLLINDGTGRLELNDDYNLRNLPGREITRGKRFDTSEIFRLMDITHNDLPDLVGWDQHGLRIWLNDGHGVLEEISFQNPNSDTAWMDPMHEWSTMIPVATNRTDEVEVLAMQWEGHNTQEYVFYRVDHRRIRVHGYDRETRSSVADDPGPDGLMPFGNIETDENSSRRNNLELIPIRDSDSKNGGYSRNGTIDLIPIGRD